MLAVVLTAVLAAAPAPCHDTHVRGDAVREARAVRCLINRERARHGLGAVRRDVHLERAAGAYSRLMVRRRFFDHVGPDGSTPTSRVRAAGYRGPGVGETIAWGTGRSGDAAGTVDRWLHSPGHRAILLSAGMRAIGVGVGHGSPVAGYSGGETVTADFGTR
jgi:uncharacterized protein YkwD